MRIEPAFVVPLMQWVEREMGTTTPIMPEVIASRSQFFNILGGMAARVAGRPQALYKAGKIYLNSDRWDPEDPMQVSLLVHELVHHAQYFSRGKWPCSNAKEEQAYTLQNKWLEMNGYAPFVNVAWIKRVSSCPDLGATAQLAQSN